MRASQLRVYDDWHVTRSVLLALHGTYIKAKCLRGKTPDEGGARSAFEWVAARFGMSGFDYGAVLLELWSQVCEHQGERIDSLVLDGVSLRPMTIEQMNADIISLLQVLGMVIDPELISGCTW